MLALAHGFYSGLTERWQEVFAAIGVAISFAFFVQKQKLEETRLFRELFREFNQRYDEMSDDLQHVFRSSKELSDEDKEVLVKYFNLCGEEYLMFKMGYISPEVWTSWKNGMREAHQVPAVQRFWDSELAGNSYYGFSFETE